MQGFGALQQVFEKQIRKGQQIVGEYFSIPPLFNIPPYLTCKLAEKKEPYKSNKGMMCMI